MNCLVSPMYGKDEFKRLSFYCEYCGKEMDYEEVRECQAPPDNCSCGYRLGTSDYQMGRCGKCDKEVV